MHIYLIIDGIKVNIGGDNNPGPYGDSKPCPPDS